MIREWRLETSVQRTSLLTVVVLMVSWTMPSIAEEEGGDAAAEMARKLQEPLANIAASICPQDYRGLSGDDATGCPPCVIDEPIRLEP